MPVLPMLLLLQAAPVAAPCPLPLVPPAPFAGWLRAGPLVAAERDDKRPQPELVPGRAAAATLAPAERVRFPVPPHGAGVPVRYGGLLLLRVPVPGTYRIALGAPAWVDVVPAGARAALPEAGHAHGSPCSGIAKQVDFRLGRGTYSVAISAAPAPVLTVEVARLP